MFDTETMPLVSPLLKLVFSVLIYYFMNQHLEVTRGRDSLLDKEVSSLTPRFFKPTGVTECQINVFRSRQTSGLGI